MKGERSFACGQRVRINCYMAIVQGCGLTMGSAVGPMGQGARARGKAAIVLVLLAKDVVSLQINTEIGKS